MDELKSVSIIVLNYNGKKFLEDCLLSLEKLNYPKNKYEIILADNNSSDGSVEYARKRFPQIKIIENNVNLGFSAGNNSAFKKINTDYVITLNNDTRVTGEWLIKLVEEAIKDPGIGMVSGKTLFMNKPDTVQVKSILLCPSGRSIEVGFGEKNSTEETVKEVFGPSGVAAMYKKEMLEETGGFDEDFFAYFEDVDLAWRAQLAGWKAIYCPDAVVYHFHSGYWIYGSSRQRYFCVRNRLWTIIKNWPLQYILLYSPWIISIHVISALWFIAVKNDFVYFRAYWDCFKGMGKNS